MHSPGNFVIENTYLSTQQQQQQPSAAPLTIHGLVGPSVNKEAKYSELPETMRQAIDEAE
jgi:hypothetical protein